MRKEPTGSPDSVGFGLSAKILDAGRYDGHKDHPREVAGVLRSLMPTSSRVLDVGAGTGSVLLLVNRDKGNTVIALEPDSERASIARSRGVDCRTGLLTDDFIRQDGLFDVVVASDVIEHVADPSAFLQLLMTATRPGGHILISTPNVAHWSVRLSLLMGRFDYEPVGIMDATHLRWFTERTVRGLAKSCGLEICQYEFSAGSDLPCYGRGMWRLIPHPMRVEVARVFSQMLPRLFGAQHVVKMRKLDT